MNEGTKVDRYRINDYVGAPIWGIRAASPLRVGDRVYFDQAPVFGGRRWHLTVDMVDGRLACRYEHNGRFCGFVERGT